MEKPLDRRSDKTRVALLTAFRDLLLEHGYDTLQVGDICTRANVGRSTFYDHFRAKDELLRASLATPFSHMADMVLPAAQPARIAPLLQHFREHQQIVRVLLGWPTRPLLSQTLAALVAARLPQDGGAPSWQRDMVARLIADAQLALLDLWILGRPACTQDEAAAMLHRSSAALCGMLTTSSAATACAQSTRSLPA